MLSAAELDLSVDELVDTIESVVSETESPGGPVIRILKGWPSADEIAAVVCVLSAAAAGTGVAAEAGPVDLWGRPSYMHRGTTSFSPYAYPFVSHLRD
ncbi:acyl-CoA carboxylase epsilon subunit [Nocardia sp. alder85J]|uniref:acyl-CoA carboxylase epsilon subunit n=1 Tax=Nocardia sp. alder85J TaxID=2862949 RepID=UPI001CD79C32|nr:acyl-CoA carboxylase epsilon subunit [Nocardia sp. alder85J]MCX4097277.1 acyl-CoA carboxylase epsilon subunit [Nocardia sp. alder85J]